jgi:hypothetical protein
MLMQQESKIGGRLMGRSDGQEHVPIAFGSAAVHIGQNTSLQELEQAGKAPRRAGNSRGYLPAVRRGTLL